MRDRLQSPTPEVGDVLNAPGYPFDGATVVACYTRAQAIADGILVDLTRIAGAHGLRIPLAMTCTAWAEALCAPHADRVPSDIEVGRFLAWLRVVIHIADPMESQIEAPFTRIDQQVTRLKIHCGPGDNREPVLTVMLPNED